ADLLEARLILGLRGLCAAPTRPVLGVQDLGSALELLQADDERINRVVSRVTAASAYGTAEVVASSSARDMLGTATGVWLLDSSRRYKLDRVASLTRTLAYLEAVRSTPGREALDFLLAQQHPTGRFGFFGPEVMHARRTTPGFEEYVELYLPVTLACLWALAESHTGGFRLLTSMPVGAGDVPPPSCA